MSSRCRDRCRIALLAALATAAQADEALRVCADPDNLPYSRADGAGFELRIARVLADELKLPLSVHWQPLRRGFVRKTLGEGACDVLIGVPAGFERVITTRPYYRSSYVFVTRADALQPLAGFDDARLGRLRIGVQLIGNDLAASPPGYALARHGALAHVTGYTIDGGDAPAAARMVRALQSGQLDAALAWGPQAGWFARQSAVPMRVHLAVPPADVPLPFEFSIAVGVKRGMSELRDRLQAALEARRSDIDAALAEYAVPRTDGGGR
jgi:quinoprotein dehydrogenase-associated probable ABC transporter substrate-binding protein